MGVLFAVVPLFEGGKAESAQDVAWFFTKLLGLLLGFLSMCAVLSLAIMPPIMRWVVGSCGPEIARLFAVSFCFALASLGDVMGVSSELGAFCAGAVIGNTRSKRMAADFDFGKYFEGHGEFVRTPSPPPPLRRHAYIALHASASAHTHVPIAPHRFAS